ncbi:MAG: hypothetical protein OXC61_10745 [Flavobacteriaceae bacterium]|nr:hypothetical protein [Flavobacteriaceae bacterium]
MPFSIQNTRSSGSLMRSIGLFFENALEPLSTKTGRPAHPSGDGGLLDAETS